MAIADETEVRNMLKEHEPDILEIVHGAWQDFMDLGIASQLTYKRNRAGLMHQFMVNRAKAKWLGSRVVVIEKDETAKFIFGGRLVARFKKADENGVGSNIQTQAELAFVDPEQELPGIEAGAKVEVVYQLNPLETKIETVAVVARNGERAEWSYSIESSEGAEIIRLPIEPAAGEEPGVVVVPKAKPGATGSQKDG